MTTPVDASAGSVPAGGQDLGDIEPAELRRAMERATRIALSYRAGIRDASVLPSVRPGEVSARIGVAPPAQPQSMDEILDDYESLIEPNLTHWNHPGFLSYFAITGSGPGLVGETLAAATNVNAMLWRTSPSAVELETRVCDWLRQMMDLPSEFVGHINDTASTSTLVALATARHRAFPDCRRKGWVALAAELGGLPVLYCSEHAHSSVDKAVLTLGLGTDQLRRIPCDADYRMDVEALRSAVEDDRAAGHHPFAVVATAGTTSTTSVDPLDAVAELCRRESLWLHVDAAYAGSAAICPELRATMAGLEKADSIVVNPHKWLFVQVDCSVLLTRGYDELRHAFSLVADYLRTDEDTVNLMDLGPQLGRRFRALKLWMVIRRFGVEGLRRRIRAHCELARRAAERLETERAFEVTAPVPFSTVCFRLADGEREPAATDAATEELLRRLNADGRWFLSSTVLGGRVVARLAIGNLATTATDIDTLLDRLVELAGEL